MVVDQLKLVLKLKIEAIVDSVNFITQTIAYKKNLTNLVKILDTLFNLCYNDSID